MTDAISRRGLLHMGAGTAAALGISAITAELAPASALAQSAPTAGTGSTISAGSGVQLFYRDDTLAEPWLQTEPVLLIHGVGESGIVWWGWVPRMAQHFRVLRPDTPGFGRSTVPKDFEWTLANIAQTYANFLDALHIESAHVIGAKLGGSIAMQFATDFPSRVRTLTVCGSPISTPVFNNTTGEVLDKKWVADTQRDRLGSAASKEQIDYWVNMMNAVNPATTVGINKVTAALNLEPVLSRIAAPTLVITSDKSSLQSVETVVRYQQKIPKSRLLVLTSDAYHVAVAKADDCVTGVLSFIKDSQTQVRA